MSKDFRRDCDSKGLVRYKTLKNVSEYLESMGNFLGMYDLPELDENCNVGNGEFREVSDELGLELLEEDLHACDSLNFEQLLAYNEIMEHVTSNEIGAFFIDRPGGIGKTYLYKALLATIRSEDKIALATATSRAAANNMSGGRTAHSRLNILIKLDCKSVYTISKQSATAKFLRRAVLIIWDEASMSKKRAIEALDMTLQDIMRSNQMFGEKVVVFGGDFRQVLSMVRCGTRAGILDSTLPMSHLWSSIKKISLTQNMRARSDPWFSQFLLRVGDGTEKSTKEGLIQIPNDMTIPYKFDKDNSDEQSISDVIEAIFPSLSIHENKSNYIAFRLILSTKNKHVDAIKHRRIDHFSSEEMTYDSFDIVVSDTNIFYPFEFLNGLTPNSLSPHILKLKMGCPIILWRNLDPANGLYNGTRLVCRAFHRNVIEVEIVVGQHAGKRIFISRTSLCPSDDDLFPFRFKRKQFSVRLSFSMTINKAQWKTVPNVGVFLPEPVFLHGQLYVALSRGVSRQITKMLIKPCGNSTSSDGVFTTNVVFQEVLREQWGKFQA